MITDSRLAGILSRKHFFSLPLDYQHPTGEQLQIFARELIGTQDNAATLPLLVFFQGGPGFGAARPHANGGWIKRALKEYRVLLLDQRGTGLSSPVSFKTLDGMTPDEQAEHLSHFRADNIIRDAEAIRAQLSPDTPWSILGQSFGGFCVLRYLSAAPQGLKEAFITGGIPSLERPATEVYRATYQRLLAKNQDFFARFKDAKALLAELRGFINSHEARLATGERLTQEMLQLLGVNLGMEQGPEAVYYLLEQALIDTPSGKALNPLFEAQFCQMLDYNTNPLFAIMHESIYCQQQAANWAAHRVRGEYPAFAPDAEELLFSGEMIYPWMFEQFANLKPLKACAELLAAKADWPSLYDPNILANNRVPVAAAIYSEDMYVEQAYSLETAARVGNLKYWLTSEYEHNGIRMDGERILDKLIALNRGQALR
ncbi:alpha/beta fold hydrolase [Shewanella algae]|uniref:alpha/beta fold hydrolase n=1 Tax=Shewanella algae TaxID=38313 RepID=UPI0007872C0F|nr:alpha/beta fold hydrolase [Shewanella algae]NKZ40988.1 alpha/beta hydrolase [Shewanella algae]QTE79746.1 alpha/beta fold hydrolase [Shewanella algae]